LVLATFLVYLPLWNADFIWDDNQLITDNRMVHADNGLYRIWFTTEPMDYWPVTSTAFWLEWRLWGNNPRGYHILNVALHAANALLLWRILRRLNVPGSWWAGLLFAVHPVNVATVAWISEQKNTLSLLLAAMTVLLYLESECSGASEPALSPVETKRRPAIWRSYSLSLLVFLLALLSKIGVATLPVVLLGCIWWMHGRLKWTDLWRTLPFFALSLVLVPVTIWFQQHRSAVGQIIPSADFLTRLANAGWIPWFYLYKALVPVNLVLIYPRWTAEPLRWVYFAPGLVLLSCFAFFWWKRNTWGRPLLFGFGYFVVMLFPVLGFATPVFSQFSLVADHWQYYAIIGPIALVVAGLFTILSHIRVAAGFSLRSLVLAALAVVLAVASWKRAAIYENLEGLWRNNLAKYPRVWVAHNNLGAVFILEHKYDDAIQQFHETLQLKPDAAVAHYNIASVYRRMNKPQQAIPEFERALEIRPDYFDAHNNLGVMLGQMGDLTSAIAHLQQAVRIRPRSAEAHSNLAAAFQVSGDIPQAIEQYRQALQIDPEFPVARQQLDRLGAQP
jgi:tetratricopeptide (TPR) repeat protein